MRRIEGPRGAVVLVPVEPREARTDGEGRYRFGRPPEGRVHILVGQTEVELVVECIERE